MKKYLFCMIAVCAASPAHAGDYSQWQFTWGGEERARYELRNDFTFSNGRETNNNQMYNRLRVSGGASLTDEYLAPKLDLFVEGLDAQVLGYQTATALGQEDNLDLHQAYATLHNVFDSDVDIKAGRQEMKYGKGRLIAAPTWANRVRAFDGYVVHYQHEALWADALYGQDVKYDDNNVNKSSSEEYLTGVYGGWQKNKMMPLVETYFLKMKNTAGTTEIQRYTVGAHAQQNFGGGVTADVEIPYQFGHTGTTALTRTIRAYAFHADVAKVWSDTAWTPQLNVSYDLASGDNNRTDNKSNTFVPLYQSTHEPYGLLDLVRWQNVRNLETGMTFSPTEKLKFSPQVDFFWLDSKYDSWYNSTGGVTRANVTPAPSSFIGTEWSMRGYYSFTDALKTELGYARFTPGEYVRDTGRHDDVDFLYTQLALKF